MKSARLATTRRDAKAGKFDVAVAEALDRISRDLDDRTGIHKRLSVTGIEIRSARDDLVDDIHIGVTGPLGALYFKAMRRG